MGVVDGERCDPDVLRRVGRGRVVRYSDKDGTPTVRPYHVL